MSAKKKKDVEDVAGEAVTAIAVVKEEAPTSALAVHQLAAETHALAVSTHTLALETRDLQERQTKATEMIANALAALVTNKTGM